MGCSWLNPHSSEKARYWFGVSSIYVKTELVKNRESIIRSHSFVRHSGNAHAFSAAKSLQALGYAEHLKWSQAGSWGGRTDCHAGGEYSDGGMPRVLWISEPSALPGTGDRGARKARKEGVGNVPSH